ncbi:hypothetical protein [Methylomonas sp. AM2-LC]|uniref:hypothetical protein n=1 Tax=Methylomonas sp. AM2-LC TaxID=3153301 RepID=UPI003265B5FC
MSDTIDNPSYDKALLKQGIVWASGQTANEQTPLLAALASADYINSLDSPEDYIRLPPKQLRITRIFKALLRNPSPVAQKTLLGLTEVAAFNEKDALVEILVKSLTGIRPAPPAAIKYWDAHSTPDSVHVHFVIDALCKNGSEPAIALLEQKMLDAEQDYDFKLAWIRDSILEQRNDLPLLQCCHRLLQADFPPELKGSLVEALCTYRKLEWYKSCDKPVPPPRALASREALLELQALCQYAKTNLELKIPETAAVDMMLSELDLMFREYSSR